MKGHNQVLGSSVGFQGRNSQNSVQVEHFMPKSYQSPNVPGQPRLQLLLAWESSVGGGGG